MGGSRNVSSKLAPFLRNAVARNRQTCVSDGASHRMITTIEASKDEPSSNEPRPKPLRKLLTQSSWRQNSSNSEVQRRRNFPVLREGLIQTKLSERRTLLRRRYFSSDSKKGLSESQIGEELLSGDKGLKLAPGEVLSPEEEAALKTAEAEFEKIRREEPVSVEGIQQLLKELSTVADPKDPRIAIVSLRLGQEYEARGEDPNVFLKLGEQALEIFKTVGEFSLEIGMCHHLIALAHHRLGHQAVSLEHLNEAVSLLKGKESAESAPIQFAVQFLLGDVLAAMGKHEEALKHYVEGLTVQETILKKDHPQLASNYRQVGEAFTQVLMFDDAKTLVEKALEIHVKHGKRSIDEAVDRRLLSVIYTGLEEHEKALEEQLTVRSILNDKNLGHEALFVEIAIADTQVTLGRVDDAIATLQNVIKNLKEGNSLRVLATVNLAKAYMSQGNEQKAGEHSRVAINLLDSRLEESLGDDTELLTIGECYTELAAIHQRMNQPTEAIDLLKKGLNIYKKLPQQMNATAGSQAQIGMLLYFTGKAEEAIPYMEEAVANLRHSFGDGHFSLALVLNHLAVAHVDLKNPEKAIELFEDSKGILTNTHGAGHQDTLAVYYNLMKIYSSLGRKEEAIANAKHIVVELEKLGEPAKSAVADAQKDLENLENDISLPEGKQQLSESMKLQAEDSVI